MKIKRVMCILLSAVLVFCCLPVFASEPSAHEWEHELKTTCGGDCGYSPVIIVPGIMQSQTYVQDAEGNDLMTSDGFPLVEGMDMSFMFDTVKVKQEIKNAVPSILKSITMRDRDGLFDILIDIFDKSFRDHYFNPDGTRVNGVSVDEYWYSLEECKTTPDRSYGYAKGYGTDDEGNTLPTTKYQNQYDFIERQVNISAFCEKAGYDHAYYYSYASFGNILETAEGLNEYIEMVKTQTGHDKVSIVFISLGGTIANTWLADYINPDEIDRIVLAAAATDGSYLLSDLMDDRSTLGDGQVIYNDLIPNIVNLAAEEYMALAYLGNTIARAIPQEVFSDFLEEALARAIDEVLAKLMRNCQSMWALVPSAEYPAMAQKYISDEAHAKLKEQT
ncbi:MAG: alpha/beta fold hydrolase, partial [Clostridia bacterium]|nr:alpha/beta fold hydrolase [Clostridia bacterium]